MYEGELGEFFKDSTSRVDAFSVLRTIELGELVGQLGELSQSDDDFDHGVALGFDLDFDMS